MVTYCRMKVSLHDEFASGTFRQARAAAFTMKSFTDNLIPEISIALSFEPTTPFKTLLIFNISESSKMPLNSRNKQYNLNNKLCPSSLLLQPHRLTNDAFGKFL